ncbi:Lysophospholipase, alpha-beta hydrolase superfamily [Nonomuraea solani]|uniref:Lysophospholipase, alpha-beta hydrolase superfamily n=1 Tax=Nonomuraea solani TaxID=1144553 RepID=A0A1H6EZ91_9ACTN|nr:alpha/beta hydrolase [Nonomuraea solani]SEH03112.1 Lysophospholipase, alpha-beta hydrolase superfamily [Nonomuraea solani]
MSESTDTKPPIVLIHGLWLTPRVWEHWIERYTRLGHQVSAPAWPGMEIEVEALRKNPEVMNGLGVTEVADFYEKVVREQAQPPLIVGHSFGGLITQILLDRGLGVAGVAIHPAPIKGVLRLPLSSLRSAFPVLSNPGNRSRTVALNARQFHYAFTNTLTAQESEAIYQRYHVPAPGRPVFQAATANLLRHPATRVNVHNDTRAPLLLIAGGADHTVPVTLVRETYQRYRKSRAVTDYQEFARMPHFSLGVPEWEKVADHVVHWAQRHIARYARKHREDTR